MLDLSIYMYDVTAFLGGSKKSEKIQVHSWDAHEDI